MAEQSLIAWTAELETGHAEIDAQHKTLVESLNRLRIAVGAGQGEEELGWCLSFLKAYTRVHFRTEEAAYAGLPEEEVAEHIASHRELLVAVDGLFREYVKGELRLLSETLDMLDAWLINHIRVADRDLLRKVGRP